MHNLPLQDWLAHHDNKHLRRTRRVFAERTEGRAIVDGKSLLNFCSNDYLHLSTHPAVKKAFADSAAEHGLGSSGSALISGYSKSHARLEEAFAEFLNRDRAILFNSGYHANLGVLTTFAGKNSTIVADKYCHASLNAGSLLSRAKFIRYRHDDIQHAEELLNKQTSRETLLVTESVFSMQGNISDIKSLAALANQHKAVLIVDDAHGIGVLGKRGAGVVEHFQLSQHDVPCLVTPLGKAIGSYGAIVSGDDTLIEAVMQFAGSYRYCTALPPAVCDGTFAALKVLQTETWRREKLLHLCEFFLKEAAVRGIELASNAVTPIMCVVIDDSKKTLQIQQALIEKGFLVSCIRPPTVPHACIRISLGCGHEEGEIVDLLDALSAESAPLSRSVFCEGRGGRGEGLGVTNYSQSNLHVEHPHPRPLSPRKKRSGRGEPSSLAANNTQACSKKTLALLPGWGFKASIWQHIAKQFPDDKVILLDLPKGKNIDHIIKEIDAQLPSNCILIGWSLGGIIATHLCLAHPHKYKKLITVASTPKFTEAEQWPGISNKDIAAFHEHAQKDLPQLMLHFQRLVNGKNKQADMRKLIQSHMIDPTENHHLLFYLDLLAQSDLRDAYAQLTLPALHLLGNEDYLIPAATGNILKQKYPHHETHIMQGAGHAPFITHTNEFMSHLLRFIHD
jgi:8-amino-7-oxononanoate synthase